MKKFLTCTAITIFTALPAYADSVELQPILPCREGTSISEPISHGKQYEETCGYVYPDCVQECTCCKTSPQYRCTCDSGYYVKDQGTSSCSCVACPKNSTCTSATNFTCNDGYEKNVAGTGCRQIACPAGQYLNGTACTDCPTGDLAAGTTINITSIKGATKITECHATGGTDSTGTYFYTMPCYYTGATISDPSIGL